MYSKWTTITNETGIHARPAGELAQIALKYPCKVTVKNASKKGDAVSAKSLMRIMGEEFVKGSVIEIAAEGESEQEAVEKMIALVNSGFSE